MRGTAPEEQLEQEEEAAAQPLPRRVGLDVRREPLPEEGRGHDRLGPPQAQQIHRDDGRHEQQAEQRQRRGERHRRQLT